jgi:8-oxo-dGTP pyrophosphatase MutT (NUDIX family)
MYEVYILNRPVRFAADVDETTEGLVLREPSDQVLRGLPALLKAEPGVERVMLVSAQLEQLWMRFCLGYKETLAAGCIVENNRGEMLWIERKGKWDLPKGKVEPGEAIEVAAVREVMEETGIGALELVEDLGATYHTYEMNGQVELKTTFWFRARHAGDDTPGVPQAEEGITAIRWVAQPVPEEMLAGTFASLRKLVENAGGG